MPGNYTFLASDITSDINTRCDYITITSNDYAITGTRSFVNNVSFAIDEGMVKELRALNTMYHEALETKDVTPEKLHSLIKTASEKLDIILNKMHMCPTLSKEEMEKYEPIVDGDEYNE